MRLRRSRMTAMEGTHLMREPRRAATADARVERRALGTSTRDAHVLRGLWRPASIAATLVMALAVLLLPASASATLYVDGFFGNPTSSTGNTGGLFNQPRGVAVNGATGDVYVVDQSNHRIQQFDASGDFVRAWGRDVVRTGMNNDVSTSAFEVCDTQHPTTPNDPADCKQGVSSGTTGGQMNTPQGIAVDDATDAVYVTDGGRLRVQEFTAEGEFVRAWGRDVVIAGQPNDVGTTAFEVCDTQHPTTPNDPSDCKAGTAAGIGGAFASTFDGYPAVVPAGAPNAGNVVVADPGNRRVQEFTATGEFVRAFGWDVVASGPGDTLENEFEVCVGADGDACQAGPSGDVPGAPAGRFATAYPKRVAVDAVGAVYTVEGSVSNRRVQKTVHTGDPPGLVPSTFAQGTLSEGPDNDGSPLEIAVDPVQGRVFVARWHGPGAWTCPDGSASANFDVRIWELTATGTVLDRHAECAGFTFSNASGRGLAFRRAAGSGDSDRLYLASQLSGHRVWVFDDDGIVPAIASIDPATAVTDTTAELSGTVDPNSVNNDFAPTTWRLQYSRNGIDWTTSSSGSLPAGTDPVAVAGQATGLLPSTSYRIRVVTRKPFGNPEVASPELTLLTDAVKPELTQVRPDSVAETSARLTGRVNPHSTPTSYRFEWGRDGFDNVLPVPDGPVGSGPTAVFVAEQLSGLQPGTTYQFRLVATSATEGATTSATKTFTTPAAPAGGMARAYELVSPADKLGGTGVGEWYRGVGSMGHSGVAAHRGERFAAQGRFGSVLLDDPAFSFANDWALAGRAGDHAGWRSHSPLSHPSGRIARASFMIMQAAASDLSAFFWGANSTPAFFPELEQERWGRFNAGFLSDWGAPPESPTRWELFGPDDLSLTAGEPTLDVQDARLWDVKLSGDASTAVGVPNIDTDFDPRLPVVAGLAGEGDPSEPDWEASPPDLGGLESGRLIYAADLSGALSDEFAIGERTLVNVCSGEAGADRTEIPAVDGGNLVAQDCPDPLADHSDRLVSDRGATLKTADGSSGSADGVVSEDGSRIFFMSPDPLATGVPDGTSQPCVGSGAATLCPPQLYVRQDNGDGTFTTRWISRAEDGLLGSQDASLTGSVRFEGASADGSRVLFRTNSPLTADDPNGAKDIDGGVVLPPEGGVTSGAASGNSWDLYLYDMPSDPGADIGDGELTRVSGGPDGHGDCNSPVPAFGGGGSGADNGEVGALRFASKDASRVYFTCAAPLPGVPAPSNGTITSPGGDHATTDETNLYLYDREQPEAERWRFVARLPRVTGADDIDVCASTGTVPRSPLGAAGQSPDIELEPAEGANCVRGTDDGGFVTFLTTGRLTADDPPAPATGDIYGYDAEADELVRISAAQAGVGGTYRCATNVSTPLCHGDAGIDQQGSVATGGTVNVALGVATDPLVAGDRIAFFQSRSRLVPEDTDDAYDVYQWRNGDLSLVTTGTSATDGALYRGNDVSGRNVYFATRDQLSWQDFDAVADIYTARVDGGIVEPVPPAPCDVLAHECRGDGPAPVAVAPATQAPSGGNASPGARQRLAVAAPRARARRRAARRGVLVLRLRTAAAGPVRAVARARIGRRARIVARAATRAEAAGRTVLRLRLSRPARRRLAAGRRLRVVVRVGAPGARTKAIAVVLRRAGR